MTNVLIPKVRKVRNFTPHDVMVVTESGTLTFPSEGVARCATTRETIDIVYTREPGSPCGRCGNMSDSTTCDYAIAPDAFLNENRGQCPPLFSIKVNSTSFGEVEGLPEPQEGTIFIVSALVAQALRGVRDDLVIPDDTVRDEQGRIIGCKSFARV